MAEIPDAIVLKRDRDLASRSREIWIRRGLIALLTVFVAAAFANVFGQRSQTAETSVPGAALTIHAPTALRSGLIFEARFRIFATQEIRDAMLVLSPGWLEGMTLNTVEPSPLGEASRNGSLSFDLGHVRQGDNYSLYLQFQVNPTTFGTRTTETRLYDGASLLLESKRDVTVFP